jgi:prepilin-type N-terminal cleavage/methylation domain-containing protein
MTRTTGTPAQRGFTLIELLVVISILTLLVVSFIPGIVDSRQDANAKETHGRMLLLNTRIEAFERSPQHGWYPPDDLTHPDPESRFAVAKDNGINTGIESLVVFLDQDRGGFLSEQAGWLVDTDKDDHKEVVDAWGTPFAYFSSTTAGSFEQPQKIRLPGDGGDVPALAWKGPDGPLGQHKYQLISAGKDKTFNTDDDIVWPERR